jgi:hypothetical protein
VSVYVSLSVCLCSSACVCVCVSVCLSVSMFLCERMHFFFKIRVNFRVSIEPQASDEQRGGRVSETQTHEGTSGDTHTPTDRGSAATHTAHHTHTF